MMAGARVVSLPSKICDSPAICWSQMWEISVSTEDGLYVLIPQIAATEFAAETNVHVTKIPLPSEIQDLDTGVDREKLLNQISQEETFHVMLDRTLSPAVQSLQSFKSYKVATWSPLGGDEIGRCVLATLTLDHRLCIFSRNASASNWTQLVDVSALWSHEVRKGSFQYAKSRQKGKFSAQLDRLRSRAYTMAPVVVTWSHVFEDPPSEEPTSKKSRPSESSCNSSSRSVLLTAGMMSGHLVTWKVNLPITSKEDFVLVNVIDLDEEDIPSAICWCQRDGILTVGFQSGVIVSFVVTQKSSGKSFTFGSPQRLWKDKDDLAVNTLCWHEQCSVLCAGKGPYLVTFEVDVDITTSSVNVLKTQHQAISDKLNITSLWYAPPSIYLSVADGHLLEVSLHKKEDGLDIETKPISLQKDTKYSWRNYGVCVSPNGVFLATVESPSSPYCHLSFKDPTKVHIRILPNMESRIPQSILLSKVSSTSDFHGDLLLYQKHKYTTQRCFSSDLESLLQAKENWSNLHPEELKVLRYLLQVKKSCKKKADAEEELEEDLKRMECEILKRHVTMSLKYLLEMSCYKCKDKEKIAIQTMCNWAEKMSENDSLKQLTQRIKQTFLNPGREEGPSWVEKCEICQQIVQIDNPLAGTCSNSHTFGRCCQTMLLSQDLPYRVCDTCGVLAISKPSQEFEWLQKITPAMCTFCEGRLVRL